MDQVYKTDIFKDKDVLMKEPKTWRKKIKNMQGAQKWSFKTLGYKPCNSCFTFDKDYESHLHIFQKVHKPFYLLFERLKYFLKVSKHPNQTRKPFLYIWEVSL